MEFLRKYLTTTRCDMFFADKLVFIEGLVERMLLPRLIAALDAALRDKLTSTYVCTVEVGGAYAHLFRKLIEFLELPALVITDLDSIDGTTKKKAPCRQRARQQQRHPVSSGCPARPSLPTLLAATPRVQKTSGTGPRCLPGPRGRGPALRARSFEEAFVYANAAWLTRQQGQARRALGDRFTHPDAAALTADAYEHRACPKVDFALDLLANEGWTTPHDTSARGPRMAGERSSRGRRPERTADERIAAVP